MNVLGTEFSIFQGAPSLHVDNNQQRIEEEEAHQDHIRRQAELDNQLQSAFDDIDIDEDVNDTMNSTRASNGNSYHSTHPNQHHQFQRTQQSFPLRDEETSYKNQMEAKAREVEYVTNQLTSERKHYKSAIDEYEKRLAIAEAEKERALMTREQTHELLVENKSQAREMEETHNVLKSKIKSLENENSSLVGELESTKLMLSDVQIKYNMVEKNVIFNADRNTDIIIKQSQERHSAQIAMMQQQIDSLKSKYDDLEHEHKNIEIRYKELQRSRESMLIEKSEIVNQLNKNLEDAQRQCQDLLARPNLSQENRHLQNLVRSAETEKEELNRTVNKLQRRLQEQKTEMELMDSIVQECGGNNNSFSESSKFVHREPLKNSNSSIPLTPEARLSRVKEELCKSLNNIKNKREEIKICEIQLREKDEEIKLLKSDENKALVQMNHYRDETIRLESKTKMLEKELDKMRNDLFNKSANHSCITDEKYEVKIKELQSQKESLESELNSIKADYERLSMKNGEMEENENEWREKVKQLEADLKKFEDYSEAAEDLKKEREKVRALDEKLKEIENSKPVDEVGQEVQGNEVLTNTCQKCEEYLLMLEKLEVSSLQLQNTYADSLTDLNKLQLELVSANREIKSLDEKLNLKELRDGEIEKLKQKAQEFEVYMRANTRSASIASSSKTSSTNTSHTKNDVSTETSDLDDASRKSVRNAETRIRDEMAKIFAAEVKSIEKQFREELERLQHKIIEITEDLHNQSQELNVRCEQLEVLKATILEERKESAKRFQEKDDDFKTAIKKYQAEYENNQLKIEELIVELNENKELIEEERLSIEHLKRQIQVERESLAEREEEALNKCSHIREETTRVIKELNEKYHSAKRTAMNYKQYAEDKEKHFRSEHERTKAVCKETVEKMEENLKESLLKKERSCQEKKKTMEAEFKCKVEMLKEMFGTKASFL